MNDIVDAVKNEDNRAAVKGYFKQLWSDVADNSWKTNLTLGIVFVLAVVF